MKQDVERSGRSSSASRRVWLGSLRWVSISLFTLLSAQMLGYFLNNRTAQHLWITGTLIAGGGAVALLSSWSLARTVQRQGTIYFLRMQPPGRGDWHRKELRELARKTASDLRVVSRELPASATSTDWSEPIKEFAAAVEQAVNNDRADTAFHYAPDLAWPAAVALGASLYLDWGLCEFHELRLNKGPKPGRPPARPGPPAEPGPATGNSPDTTPDPNKGFQWHPTIQPHGGHDTIGAHKKRSRPMQLGKEQATGEDLATTSHSQSMRPLRAPELQQLALTPSPTGPATAVIVTLNLTTPRTRSDGAPEARPQGNFVKWYGVGLFTDDEPSYLSPVKPVRIDNPKRWWWPERWWPRKRGGPGVIGPWMATNAAVGAIRLALHENPTARIYVAAMLPKSVAVAVGWHLFHDELVPRRCLCPACANPWERLVLLDFNRPRYTPVRIHPGQPSVEKLMADWKSVTA